MTSPTQPPTGLPAVGSRNRICSLPCHSEPTRKPSPSGISSQPPISAPLPDTAFARAALALTFGSSLSPDLAVHLNPYTCVQSAQASPTAPEPSFVTSKIDVWKMSQPARRSSEICRQPCPDDHIAARSCTTGPNSVVVSTPTVPPTTRPFPEIA